jgi:hypothetical protein
MVECRADRGDAATLGGAIFLEQLRCFHVGRAVAAFLHIVWAGGLGIGAWLRLHRVRRGVGRAVCGCLLRSLQSWALISGGRLGRGWRGLRLRLLLCGVGRLSCGWLQLSGGGLSDCLLNRRCAGRAARATCSWRLIRGYGSLVRRLHCRRLGRAAAARLAGRAAGLTTARGAKCYLLRAATAAG